MLSNSNYSSLLLSLLLQLSSFHSLYILFSIRFLYLYLMLFFTSYLFSINSVFTLCLLLLFSSLYVRLISWFILLLLFPFFIYTELFDQNEWLVSQTNNHILNFVKPNIPVIKISSKRLEIQKQWKSAKLVRIEGNNW